MRFVAISVLIAVMVSVPALGQQNAKAEIKRIDSYVKLLDRYTKRNKNSFVILADVAEFGSETQAWQRFGSVSELDKFMDSNDVYTSANVWWRKGRVAYVAFTYSSPSGDWAKYVSIYFRPNGILARMDAELRTFYGDFIVQQRSHFDSNGSLMKSIRTYLDLSTRKPKPPTADLQSNDELSNDGRYYLTIEKLPFAHLIKVR